jgi:hypothetical protein
LPSAGAREGVILGAAILLGHAPGCLDPALVFEPMESRIERALLDLQDVARQLLDPFREGPAMLRLELQRFQNEEVERPLNEVDGLDGRSP